jgi:hypothetical protein
MKETAFIAVAIGIALVWYLSTRQTRETFAAEFVDKTNDKRTADTSSSSYAQTTNHLTPTPVQMGPIPGLETPFRVNMYNSYQV